MGGRWGGVPSGLTRVAVLGWYRIRSVNFRGGDRGLPPMIGTRFRHISILAADFKRLLCRLWVLVPISIFSTGCRYCRRFR